MTDKLKEIPKEIQFKNIRDRVYRLEPLNSSYPEFAVGTIQRVTYQLGIANCIKIVEEHSELISGYGEQRIANAKKNTAKDILTKLNQLK